jgi:hypothetical protein
MVRLLQDVLQTVQLSTELRTSHITKNDFGCAESEVYDLILTTSYKILHPANFRLAPAHTLLTPRSHPARTSLRPRSHPAHTPLTPRSSPLFMWKSSPARRQHPPNHRQTSIDHGIRARRRLAPQRLSSLRIACQSLEEYITADLQHKLEVRWWCIRDVVRHHRNASCGSKQVDD